MYNSNIPPNQELPSTGRLIKSTIIAALVAGAILITLILPAEYGIDPTGIGKALGLKDMGEIKVSLAKELAIENTAANQTKEEAIEAKKKAIAKLVKETKAKAETKTEANSKVENLSDKMTLTLAPGEGKEIKVSMAKAKAVQYSWHTSGGKVNFDVHGDSKKLRINYHNYSKGSGKSSEGTLTADFDGSHGWFWRNRTSETLTITLFTKGEYTDIKVVN